MRYWASAASSPSDSAVTFWNAAYTSTNSATQVHNDVLFRSL